MKCTKMILAVIFAFVATSFDSSVAAKKEGIVFFKGSWSDALVKAKAEKKYIFLDIYATWCGPCKQLKRKSFKDKEVGAYYNKNFINVSIDGESDEGRELAYKYQVSGYPSLYIIDYNGRKMTKAEGFMAPYILINFGRRIVP